MASEESLVAESSAGERPAQSVTSLYVGDLDHSVTECDLRHHFGRIDGVISTKVCRDHNTNEPRGYGFVDFLNSSNAKKAMDVLNGTLLNGKCIRISYSDRNATQRRSISARSVFVKNLNKEIDDKALDEIFSPCGRVISSKVVTDSFGHSKGCAFVEYYSEESAKNAIDQLNKLLIKGQKLSVEPFIARQEKKAPVNKSEFTNVFVKNFSELTTKDDLKTIFGGFGPIISAIVIKDQNGNSKCYGFVHFQNPEDADLSVEGLHGKMYDGKKWHVGKAMKKHQRKRLNINYLDEDVDDDKLKEMFSSFGTIISCRAECDAKGKCIGSGFVEFSTAQEAERALSQMHCKMVGSRLLHVAVEESREDRQQKLQVQSKIEPKTNLPLATPPIQPKTNLSPVTSRLPMFSPGGPSVGQPILYGPRPQAIVPPMPRFGYQQVIPSVTPVGPVTPNTVTMVQQGSHGPRPDGGGAVQPSHWPDPLMYHQTFARETASCPRPASMVPFGHEIDPPASLPERTSRSTEDLASALANASPSQRTTMLGEILYPLVKKLVCEMVPKITGMLLEMDHAEVLHLVETPESLRAKVGEAMDVMRNNPSEQSASWLLDK